MKTRIDHRLARVGALGAALLLAGCLAPPESNEAPWRQVSEGCHDAATQVTYEETEHGAAIVFTNLEDVDKARRQAHDLASPHRNEPVCKFLYCIQPSLFSIEPTACGARARVELADAQIRKDLADLANHLNANGGEL
jgi:hypothetical protein